MFSPCTIAIWGKDPRTVNNDTNVSDENIKLTIILYKTVNHVKKVTRCVNSCMKLLKVEVD